MASKKNNTNQAKKSVKENEITSFCKLFCLIKFSITGSCFCTTSEIVKFYNFFAKISNELFPNSINRELDKEFILSALDNFDYDKNMKIYLVKDDFAKCLKEPEKNEKFIKIREKIAFIYANSYFEDKNVLNQISKATLDFNNQYKNNKKQDDFETDSELVQ